MKGFKSRQRRHWPLSSSKGMAAAAKKTGAIRPLVSVAKRERGPHASRSAWAVRLSRPVMKAVEREEQQEAQQRFGNGEAREEKRPDRGEHAEAGIESRRGGPMPRAAQSHASQAAEHGEGVGQVRGEGVLAEDAVQSGVEPIGQRRLLKIADAVDFHGDPVAAFGHVLRDLRVGGVDVVEQRRSEERSELDGKEYDSQKDPRG